MWQICSRESVVCHRQQQMGMDSFRLTLWTCFFSVICKFNLKWWSHNRGLIYWLWVRFHTQTLLITRIKPALLNPSGWHSHYIHQNMATKHDRHKQITGFPSPEAITASPCAGISVRLPRLHELYLTAPLVHQHVSFCYLCCWQGGSLGHIVWVWQLSAPWHLSERCSASPTCGRPGCATHTRPSGRMELLEQMERRRKLKVTDICQGEWHWRRLRHVVILITLKLVAFFVSRSYSLFLS